MKKNEEISSPFFFCRQTVGYFPLILLVEDDVDTRVMLRYLLDMWNYCVIEAEDGEEGVRLAESERPDLVLMDVKLPGIDGFVATRQIRQLENNRDVPIVFLSGCAEARYRAEGFAAGGNDYLVKPIDFNQLETALDKYIGKAAMLNAISKSV